MFSTAQLDLIKATVAEMRDEGFVYYLAYQNNGVSSGNPDLYIIFSKDEIFGKDLYSYFIPSDSVRYNFRTSNSTSYGDRVTVTDLTDGIVTFNIDSYNHISTNATFTSLTEHQPDYCITEVYGYETLGACCFVLCVSLFLSCFFRFFRR